MAKKSECNLLSSEFSSIQLLSIMLSDLAVNAGINYNYTTILIEKNLFCFD